MSTLPYIPRLDSLPDKVCRYFVRLPDEELLSREIAANYGTITSNVGHQLQKAVEADYLQCDGSVYSAGKKLHLFSKALQTHEQPRGGVADVSPAPDAAESSKRQRRLGKTFQFDLTTVSIDPGLPVPPNHRTGMDWPGLFDRLQVGDSFALPAEGRSSVQKAATLYKRATGKEMALRMVDQGIRVWRVK